MSQVWIVDDEPAICLALRTSLESDSHTVRVFSSAEPLLKLFSSPGDRPDALLLDIRLPGISGLDALQKIHSQNPDLPVVVMTAFGDLQTAVNAIRGKAFEYLTKPFELEFALQAIRRALAQRNMLVTKVDEQLASQLQSDLLLGTSIAMQTVYKQIAIAASREATVLIEGERGTGKSVVAAMIHRFSSRSTSPLLAISPIADRAVEFETELFGAKSADLASSAIYRSGLMELAGTGTLVIDEIGLVPLATQSKLLAAIESRTYIPLMDSIARTLSARLLFTTIHDIDRLTAEGELNDQLRSHLQVYRIALPPLRDRREDIPHMAQAFLSQVSKQAEMKLSQNAMRELERRDWLGNVRELRQAIQRAAMNATGRIIQLEDLPPTSHEQSTNPISSATSKSLVEATNQWIMEQLRTQIVDNRLADTQWVGALYDELLSIVEPPLIAKALEMLNGNRAAVSALLGMHRSTLRQKMKRFDIE